MDLEPDALDLEPDDQLPMGIPTEPIDVEELVRKARRSRQIAEADVQSILATASEDEADLLYERLQKLNIRIVSADGEALDDPGEIGLLENLDDLDGDVEDLYLGDAEDDPVHTYLKEIGQVPLLTAEQEIWLATQMQAARVLDRVNYDVGLNRSNNNAHAKKRNRAAQTDNGNGDTTESNGPTGTPTELRTKVMGINYANLLENWQCVLDAAPELKKTPPEWRKVMAEARGIRVSWQSGKPSYVRNY